MTPGICDLWISLQGAIRVVICDNQSEQRRDNFDGAFHVDRKLQIIPNSVFVSKSQSIPYLNHLSNTMKFMKFKLF